MGRPRAWLPSVPSRRYDPFMVFGRAAAEPGVRFDRRASMYMALAPHVDGDPIWGSARSRQPGAICLGCPAQHDGRIRRHDSAVTVASSTRRPPESPRAHALRPDPGCTDMGSGIDAVGPWSTLVAPSRAWARILA